MKVLLIVLAAVLGLVGLLLPIILLFFADWPTAAQPYSWLMAVRDASLIYASMFMCIGAILFLVVVVLLGLILVAIRDHVVPALEKVDDTARTVRGTATFVSESVVAPIIKVAGAASGAKAAVQTLMRRKPPKEGK
jgi:uncharacterized membrane protein YedE/YeeE